MAVVDVIDLTISPPSAIIDLVDDEKVADITPSGGQDPKDKKSRKRRPKDEPARSRWSRRERRNQEKIDPRPNEIWKHDKFVEEDQYCVGEERKRDNNAKVARSRRERSPTSFQFMIDTTAEYSLSTPFRNGPTSSIPPSVEPVVEPPTQSPNERPGEPPVETGLLLPAHVTLAENDYDVSLSSGNPRLSPNLDASGIDFLDDDSAVGAQRYFHVKAARLLGPCTTCGDDDHDFKSCPNMVCLTCGARNEHKSRSCPILRFCWNCKAKGHVVKDCPRLESMNQLELHRQDCGRCGSWRHHGTNCPSLWRIYTYLTDAEREDVLNARESKRRLGFDNGGEGYIARDNWCYNCGGCGHLGDDCEKAPNYDRPNDYSAFGAFNKLSGPFASSSAAPQLERPPREWEEGERFDDGHGFSADNNVGKKSREKAKAKAQEAQQQLEADNDETDWFNTNRARSTNEAAKAKPLSQGEAGLPPKPLSQGEVGLPPKPLPHPVIRFGAHDSSLSKPPLDPGSYTRPRSGPSLRDRIDMGERRSTESHRNGGRKEIRGRDRGMEAAEPRRRDSDEGDSGYNLSHNEPRSVYGSRWRGGYER